MNKHVLEIIRFGSVGLAVTLIHAVIYLALVSNNIFNIVDANIIGFIVAFVFSWIGHHYWTFKESNVSATKSFIKFVLVALLGLASNILLTILFVDTLSFPKQSGVLPIVFITPTLIYLISKYWAFR